MNKCIDSATADLATKMLASVTSDADFDLMEGEIIEHVIPMELFGPEGLTGLSTDISAWDWIAANRETCLRLFSEQPYDHHFAAEDPIAYANEVVSLVVDDILYDAIVETDTSWDASMPVTPQMAMMAMPYVTKPALASPSSDLHRCIVPDVANALATAIESDQGDIAEWVGADSLEGKMDAVTALLPIGSDAEAFSWFASDAESVIETVGWINDNVSEHDIPDPIADPEEYAKLISFAIADESIARAIQETRGFASKDDVVSELRRTGATSQIHDLSTSALAAKNLAANTEHSRSHAYESVI